MLKLIFKNYFYEKPKDKIKRRSFYPSKFNSKAEVKENLSAFLHVLRERI